MTIACSYSDYSCSMHWNACRLPEMLRCLSTYTGTTPRSVYSLYYAIYKYKHIETSYPLAHLHHPCIIICEEEHHQHEPQVYHALIFFRTEKKQNSKCSYTFSRRHFGPSKHFPKTPNLREVWLDVYRDPFFPYFYWETFSRCWNHYIKHVPCQ